MATSPESAYEYARDTIKGRWPEAESIIMTNKHCVDIYAKNVIKGRWIEAEPIIMTDTFWVHMYHGCRLIYE